MARTLVVLTAVLLLAACSEESSVSSTAPTAPVAATSVPAPTEGTAQAAGSDELFPDVIAATATEGPDGTWSFSATLSSPYDSRERYADAWRVLAPDGTELGIRVLAHDHAGEQPFTRSLGHVEIPADVAAVIIEGRDQVSGWGGATVEVDLNP